MSKRAKKGSELRQPIWSVITDGARVAEHLTYDDARKVSAAHVAETGKQGTYIVTDKAASGCPAIKTGKPGAGKRRQSRKSNSPKK